MAAEDEMCSMLREAFKDEASAGASYRRLAGKARTAGRMDVGIVVDMIAEQEESHNTALRKMHNQMC